MSQTNGMFQSASNGGTRALVIFVTLLLTAFVLIAGAIVPRIENKNHRPTQIEKIEEPAKQPAKPVRVARF